MGPDLAKLVIESYQELPYLQLIFPIIYPPINIAGAFPTITMREESPYMHQSLSREFLIL